MHASDVGWGNCNPASPPLTEHVAQPEAHLRPGGDAGLAPGEHLHEDAQHGGGGRRVRHALHEAARQDHKRRKKKLSKIP